jgi:hypothetical protein
VTLIASDQIPDWNAICPCGDEIADHDVFWNPGLGGWVTGLCWKDQSHYEMCGNFLTPLQPRTGKEGFNNK